jgi:apolipoprotein N-acyltransferase
MPAPMAALAVLLLGAAMGLYAGAMAPPPGCASAGRCRCRRQSAGVPGLWALFEWVRGWLFTGFPWLSSAMPTTTARWPASPRSSACTAWAGWPRCWPALLLLLHRTRLRAAGLAWASAWPASA